MYFLLKMGIFRCYVSLLESSSFGVSIINHTKPGVQPPDFRIINGMSILFALGKSTQIPFQSEIKNIVTETMHRKIVK